MVLSVDCPMGAPHHQIVLLSSGGPISGERSTVFRTGGYTNRVKIKLRFRNLLLPALVLSAIQFAYAQEMPEWRFTEGVNYDRLSTQTGTASPPGKIEIVEFFTYGCSYCYRMEPYIEAWRKKQPDDVSFVPVPVIGNKTMETHARLFLALRATRVLNDAHRDAFRTIHTEKRMLLTAEDQERFVKRLGLSAEAFRKAYGSFEVGDQMKQTRNLMLRYRILVTPTFVINQTYLVKASRYSSFTELLDIVDELVLRVRSEGSSESEQ